MNPAITPASPPPLGEETNFIDPRTMWPNTIATCSVCFALTVPTVLLRLFTKLRILKKMEVEDYLLIAAQLGLTVWLVLLLVEPARGADIWNTSLIDLEKFLYWSNLIIVLYCPTVLIAKWAVVVQIERIFTVTSGLARWTARGIISTATLFYFIAMLCDIFQCRPREKIWQPQLPGSCLNINGILLATCWFNFFSDLMIMAIPVLVVRGLQMPAFKKTLTCVVFGIIGVAGVIAILRVVYTFKYIASENPTRDIFPVAYWAGVEMAVIVCATAIPTIPRFFEWCKTGFTTTTNRRQTASFIDRPKQPAAGPRSWTQLINTPYGRHDLETSDELPDHQVYGGIVRTVDISIEHSV